MCSSSRAFLHFYAQGFSVFVSHSQKHTHLQNTCIFTYIRKYVRVHTYFHHTLPQAVGSLVSISCYAYIHMHKHTHTRMYIKTHVLTFRFFFSFCFAYVLLPHSHSHTRTRSRQQAITKTTVTTTTTAIKTIITLLLLRCGTT